MENLTTRIELSGMLFLLCDDGLAPLKKTEEYLTNMVDESSISYRLIRKIAPWAAYFTIALW